jgi:AcrR family transcriptional regulator
MPTEYPGRGDLAKTIRLLWRAPEPARPGPRPRLTLDQIVDAAIELADEAGLDRLSMRLVAERLDVGTMSLYRYVPSKAELLDLMVDRVSSQVRPTSRARHWRARLEHVAQANRRLYEQHPWLLLVFPGRPPMGPGVIAKYDAELRSLEGIGLSDVEMDLVLTLVLGYVRGATLSLVESAHVVERTGLDDNQWWETIAPTLEAIFDPQRYPLASRVGVAATEEYGGAFDPELAFEFGLQRVLDGVAAIVDRRSG